MRSHVARVFVTLGLAIIAASAQADTHVMGSTLSGFDAVPPAAMTARIQRTAHAFVKGGISAPRYAEIDIAWPATSEEYRQLGCSAVVLLSVVTRDDAELPIKRAYVRIGGASTELAPLSRMRTSVTDSEIRSAIGSFREDVFYLLPGNLALKKGAIEIDFATHRTDFAVFRLPASLPNFVRRTMASHKNNARAGVPDVGALRALIGREYPGWRFEKEAD